LTPMSTSLSRGQALTCSQMPDVISA
jgi:hypothetical protein